MAGETGQDLMLFLLQVVRGKPPSASWASWTERCAHVGARGRGGSRERCLQPGESPRARGLWRLGAWPLLSPLTAPL